MWKRFLCGRCHIQKNGVWYDIYVAVEKFWHVFHNQPSRTAWISSSSSMEKEVEAMRFLSTVLTEDMIVV